MSGPDGIQCVACNRYRPESAMPVKTHAEQPTLCIECLQRGAVFHAGKFIGYAKQGAWHVNAPGAIVLKGAPTFAASAELAAEHYVLAGAQKRHVGMDISRFDVAIVRCQSNGRLRVATLVEHEREAEPPHFVSMPFEPRQEYLLTTLEDDARADALYSRLRTIANMPLDGTTSEDW